MLKNNMIQLDEELEVIETDALNEEKSIAEKNYSLIKNEIKELEKKLPHPDVTKYSTVSASLGYDGIDDLKSQKKANEPIWEKIEKWEPYARNPNLYSGHLNVNDISNYYFMEHPSLKSKYLPGQKNDLLVNVDDQQYNHLFNLWHHPNENKDISYSRKLTMKYQNVDTVDVIYDKSSSIASNITDTYLRKALLKNKNKEGFQSIIQTIQKKQNTIRSLSMDNSFVVQGCAGSGKTMVLLHRLRYLLFNNMISPNEYILLIPSIAFQEFIQNVSNDFNIRRSNIFTFFDYYKKLSTTKSDIQEKNELIFDSEYLDTVYSKDFIIKCYKLFFNHIFDITNSYVEECDSKLNKLYEEKLAALDKQKDKIISDAISLANKTLESIQPHIQLETIFKLSDFENTISTISNKLNSYKLEYSKLSNTALDISISDDDPRILTSSKLIEINKELDSAIVAFEKASMFTRRSHKKRVENLNIKKASIISSIKEDLIKIDKEQKLIELEKAKYIVDNITIDQLESIFSSINSTYFSISKELSAIDDTLYNYDKYFTEKYSKEIHMLNSIIENISTLSDIQDKCCETLTPCYSLLSEYIKSINSSFNIFLYLFDEEKEKEFYIQNFKLFADKSDLQLQGNLNTLLFNIIKKEIRKTFKIKICNQYKHYWFLNVYCRYLTRDFSSICYKHIFIDEGQDLSVAELELINKINQNDIVNSKPIFNIFGDINQVITNHGIKYWEEIDFIYLKYQLNENFRNTNQIIDFCNKEFPFEMSTVGVDMEKVSVFGNLEDVLKTDSFKTKSKTFIVKDDYYSQDLLYLCNKYSIENYEIYTVKNAKGLEFKEIYVFDIDMLQNEKYISYTRALSKLNIIKTLPQETDRSISLIIDGDDI